MRGRIAGAIVLVLAASACSQSAPPPPSAAAEARAPSTPARARPVGVRVIGPSGDVADATVCATRTGGEERCGTTGVDGRAILEILPGTYAVRATPASGARLAEAVVAVDLGEGTSVVVAVEGRTTISGSVRSQAGDRLGDAEACAHSVTSGEVKCVRTTADGAYRIPVRPGNHKVEITGPPGSRLVPRWARERVASGEADLIDTRTADVVGVDVVLPRGVVLTGAVTEARTGIPVNEAQVCTYPLSAPLGWDCERTDKNGRYAVLRPPDRYWVWTIPPGDRGSRLMFQRYDRVLEGVDATPFDLRQDATLDVALTDGVVLRGRVTAQDGIPLVLAQVCLDTAFPTGRICRDTGDDGSYEIATRPQTYVVSVVPPDGSDVVGGFWPDAQPDWTKADEVRVGAAGARLDIQLPRGVRLTGTIRDERGAPLGGATINVNDAAAPRFFASTDQRGRYSVAVLPGTYTVDVFAPRWPQALSVLGQRIDLTADAGYDAILPDGPAD